MRPFTNALAVSAAVSLAVAAACTTTHTEVDRLDCNSCHATEYDTAPQVVSPCAPTDHVQAGYSRTCSDCHGTAAWCPAEPTHDQFRISSGSHAGWDCADCHLSIEYDPPSIPDPNQITCTSCHWHDQDRTDPRHLGNGDYEYTPSSCLRCHGRGRR